MQRRHPQRVTEKETFKGRGNLLNLPIRKKYVNLLSSMHAVNDRILIVRDNDLRHPDFSSYMKILIFYMYTLIVVNIIIIPIDSHTFCLYGAMSLFFNLS